jgi:N6-L-threonylcarbamoyladenine synthase
MSTDSSNIIILGIESSCDDTSAAIIHNGKMLSNVIATQEVHKAFGGVVPELASRAHQKNIIPVVDQAIKKAGISRHDISAVAFTRGPGLLGSLLVGTSFAKSFALGMNIPLVEVNHMQAHILAHFIQSPLETVAVPEFPFLCLTVSGGHTQIVKITAPLAMEVLGETIDDAAGEAFDKVAKIMGFPYPGGPLIDKHAKAGNREAFEFARPKVDGYGFSFSGLKTSFLYSMRKQVQQNPNFIEENKADICASIQHTIVRILMHKLKLAAKQENIDQIAIAGGVSANSELRNVIKACGGTLGWKTFIPKFEYCTDNAAMIAMTGYYKFLNGEFASQDISPMARMPL